MIGQTLNNRYQVNERLGKGAMGIVYRGVDMQTGQDIALKVIAIELTFEPGMLERFKREGEALRRMDHPNIVKFIDALQHEDTYVIVMEYVSGGSLQDLIKKGPLPVEQARQIALDLADALIRSHYLNIIHRDLKPENILMTEDGKPKLADFGVARLSEGTQMTRSGAQVGTPYYMSPEAWDGKKLDEQADIWSLGVIFFEMLTGRVPFDGDTGSVVMKKVFTAQTPDLRKIRSDMPIGLSSIVAKMLTRDLKKRYKTMRQVAVDLESGEQVISKSKGRSATFMLLSGIGLLIFVVVAGLIVWGLARFFGTENRSSASIPEAGQYEGAVKVVSQSPLTGEENFTGTAIMQAASLAQAQLDDNLVTMGFDVQFESFDDASNPSIGIGNAKDIISDPDVLCGVGHMDTDVMLPAMEEYHAGGLPFVSPVISDTAITNSNYLEINRVVGRVDVEAKAMETYILKTLRVNSVNVIFADAVQTRELADAFQRYAEEDGMDIVMLQYPEGIKDFTEIANTVVSDTPGVVFISGTSNIEIGSLMFQLRDSGYAGAFAGGEVLDHAGLVLLPGVDNLIFGGGTYYVTIAAPASNYPNAADFALEYTARFGDDPPQFAAQAYDAMGVCLEAIEVAASESGGLPTRAQVAQAIRNLTYKGITGTISFDENGELMTAKYFINKVAENADAFWGNNEIVDTLELSPDGR